MIAPSIIAWARKNAGAIALAATAIIIVAPPASARAADADLLLQSPKLAEMRPGEVRPLYLIIKNQGQEDDRLMSIRSVQFGQAVMLDPARRPLAALRIPAGAERALGPKGDALLVLGAPGEPWIEGEKATLEVTFEKAGRLLVSLRAGPRPSGGLAFTLSERSFATGDAARSGAPSSDRGLDPIFD